MPRLALVVALLLPLDIFVGARSSASDPNPIFELSTYAAGQSAVHRLSFRVDAGDPEIYRASISYPHGFRFAGFDRLGPPGTPVGAYEVDANLDGTVDRMLPLLCVDGSAAYVDIIPDATFSPGVEPVIVADGGAQLQLRLPLGGDANASTLVVPLSARITLVLYQHLIVNPSAGGDYAIGARFVSVDPDTDGANDGTGSSPQTTTAQTIVRIAGPMLVPFAKLQIAQFDLKLHGRHRDRFTVRGHFVPGAAGDGIDLDTEEVAISFASFSQAIPASAFGGSRHNREYKASGPGVRRLEIRQDGRFDLDVSDLHLIDPGPRARFTLRIGNDRGEAVIALPRKPKDPR